MNTDNFTQEMIEAFINTDQPVLRVTVYEAGRQYQIMPAGLLRQLWNWLRGYRR